MTLRKLIAEARELIESPDDEERLLKLYQGGDRSVATLEALMRVRKRQGKDAIPILRPEELANLKNWTKEERVGRHGKLGAYTWTVRVSPRLSFRITQIKTNVSGVTFQFTAHRGLNAVRGPLPYQFKNINDFDEVFADSVRMAQHYYAQEGGYQKQLEYEVQRELHRQKHQ